MRPVDPAKVVRAVPSTTRNDLYMGCDSCDFIYENPGYSKLDVAKDWLRHRIALCERL